MPITDPVWTSPNRTHEDFIRPVFGAKRKADHSAELMHDDESSTLYMPESLKRKCLYPTANMVYLEPHPHNAMDEAVPPTVPNHRRQLNMETDTETAYYQQSPIHTTTNMSNNNNNCAMVPDHQGMLPDGNHGNYGNHAQNHPQQLPSMCSYYSQPHTLTPTDDTEAVCGTMDTDYVPDQSQYGAVGQVESPPARGGFCRPSWDDTTPYVSDIY